MKHPSDTSYLLRDDITGDWVVIAPGRRRRLDGIKRKTSIDPFALSRIPREDILARYGRGANTVTVIRNSFPIFQPKGEVTGRQELIVEGAKTVRFCDSSPARIAALLDAFAERFRVLRRDRSIRYIQAFKNEGQAAGASQPHPHSQIFALSFVPERLRDEAKRRRAAMKRLGTTAHAHALRLATPERTVYADRFVIAFANPTARLAYEIRIVPRRAIDNITKTTGHERQSLAAAIHALLPLMKARDVAYNFFFHDVLDERDEHFEIRFAPRANIWGGFELDAGVFVNPVPAEVAAAEYRAA